MAEDVATALLLRGALLEEACRYDDLSQLEREYTAASSASEEALRNRATRTNRLIRQLAVVAMLFGTIASILAVVAYLQRRQALSEADAAGVARATAVAAANEAQNQRNTAVAAQAVAQTAQAETEQQRQMINAQRLAFAAQGQLRERPGTALLLAYEAAAWSDNPVTAQILRNMLDEVRWQPTSLSGTTGAIENTAFSPDGTRMLTVSDNDSIRLWDATGKLLVVLQGHKDPIMGFAFS